MKALMRWMGSQFHLAKILHKHVRPSQSKQMCQSASLIAQFVTQPPLCMWYSMHNASFGCIQGCIHQPEARQSVLGNTLWAGITPMFFAVEDGEGQRRQDKADARTRQGTEQGVQHTICNNN